MITLTQEQLDEIRFQERLKGAVMAIDQIFNHANANEITRLRELKKELGTAGLKLEEHLATQH